MTRTDVSLFRQLLFSYLLVIAISSLTIFIASEALASTFFRQHMARVMPLEHALLNQEARLEDLGRAHQGAMTQALLWGVAVSTLVAGAVGLLVSHHLTTPLVALKRASQRIAAGRYRERLATTAPGEIGALAGSFNDMAAALEHTEARRVELLTDVAHEMRTPLNSLHGYLEGLQDGVFVADAETLGACERQVARLERLVADLSLLSRVESRKESLVLEATPVTALLEQAIAAFQPQYTKKGVALRHEGVSPELTVLADPQRMGQVLANLLANALRHTPVGGTVLLTGQKVVQRVVIEVRDTGTGIPAEDLPHIFTRFYRADKARRRDADEGSGIGLTIAKHLVEAHGGEIGVASTPCGGSCFSVSLPTFTGALPKR